MNAGPELVGAFGDGCHVAPYILKANRAPHVSLFEQEFRLSVLEYVLVRCHVDDDAWRSVRLVTRDAMRAVQG